jgi:hypothetical protein
MENRYSPETGLQAEDLQDLEEKSCRDFRYSLEKVRGLN